MTDHNNGFCQYDGYYNSGFQFSYEDDFASQQLQQPPGPLPFVQIHTTNVQPTSSNFGNIFRRSQNSHEIKSEPIKSEQNDQNQNIAVSTRTTPVASETPPITVQSRLQPEPLDPTSQLRRCLQCEFLTLSQESLNNHISISHATFNGTEAPARRKVKCPGCENVVLARKSLEAHLEHDHLMLQQDISAIVEHLFILQEEEPRKSRIYLKNVDCLREPTVRVSASDAAVEENSLGFGENIPDFFEDSSLIEIFHNESDDFLRPPSRMKQKISIKSVDVLREPSLFQDQPKIYIKNVEFLKEPIFLGTATGIGNTLQLNDDLSSNLFQTPPPVPEPTNEFHALDDYSATMPKEAGKIYIRDAAEMAQKKPNFIHLRTVDELNLMNTNDVQHLIAPNLDPGAEENSKNSEESTFHALPQISSFPGQFHSNWVQDYDLHNLENIIDSNSGDLKNSHIDLNTPQAPGPIVSQPLMSENDDPEILFVCAQEIINDNQNHQDECLPLPTEMPSSGVIEIDLKRDEVHNVPEKGRIYVSENLMADKLEEKKSSARGRPAVKAKKSTGDGGGFKCEVAGCTYRFKTQETWEYHKKCHSPGPEKMQCPECQTTGFSNWNTLHTHLWRSHKVDMELYSCGLCNFKTPIYSRLTNTHAKIHSEERNYKCDQCQKAFKNSKQLKNHRRLHRVPLAANEVHKCLDCGLAFSHLKTLKSHDCRDPFKCDVCGKEVTSKSALKLHLLTHEMASKFKCSAPGCEYVTNDHNAIRRHKMTHEEEKMYKCPHCDYKSIQSVLFQKHIQQKHPNGADSIILKCGVCSFSTINRCLYNVHLAKHDNLDTTNVEKGSKSSEQDADAQQPRNKIKVKSDLVLTDPTKFTQNRSEEEGIT